MTKEIQRWADPAMFKAEPVKADEGPRVYLLWMTPDPLGAIAAACKMYKGEVVRNLANVTDAERREYLEQITKTKLQAPFEFVKFHFMIEGVTRAFTHQMVRQRTAVYAQESMRFAVKEDMPVGLPPSIAHIPLPIAPYGDNVVIWSDMPEFDRLSNEQKMRVLWEESRNDISDTYNRLVGLGMPAEDARGLAPTNVLTRLHYSTDLRALLDHAGNRLCTQAQFEWRLVFTRIVETIRNHDPLSATLRRHGAMVYDNTGKPLLAEDGWQYRELSNLFRPVCYATGKCEFMANFDRNCAIRDRVQANHAIGRPSNEWHEPHYFPKRPDAPADEDIEAIQAIRPEEWLLNPAAAR